MGGISSALVMDGPINKIEEQVRSTIQLLGKDGGYFCTVDQGLPFPEENLNALYKAVATYGKYPIEY
jgi:hypothetical protein